MWEFCQVLLPCLLNSTIIHVFVGPNVIASQLSQFVAFVASRAIDGDLTSFSHTDSYQTNGTIRWWRVDLAAIYDITQFKVITRLPGTPYLSCIRLAPSQALPETLLLNPDHQEFAENGLLSL